MSLSGGWLFLPEVGRPPRIAVALMARGTVAPRPKLRLFGQVILGLMWGFGGGGWFGSDYAAMVRGMVASMRSKARR